jgi:hypothetical protein|eukprot:CAMPEP_0202481860 /NCGR_PEP_ID=MMETSP1361-20130828/1336_1 /ASSEMBLY_ACC=CAM_ASM_000849 /TAXON_ID=210615 /ORGANISM="Staurosira complex sp., Strain CCMP2646" /LENGTH=139 /DNA_ID=CAMNT_0049109493 /DNA_START=252 /DNA_END=671 /DNA_ORIENTATION=-
MPPRVLCCSNNRAAVADAYSPLPQMKKSIIREWEKLSTAVTSDTDQESRTSLDKEQVRPNESLDESVFRTTPSLIPEDDGEDLLSLKRANPVFDEDEEYEEDYVPAKRQRRSTTDTFTICWNDRIVQDEEEGYQIILQE